MTTNRLKLVIDTNVLLVSTSSKSKYHWLYQALLDKKFDVYITNEILTEYEEVFKQHWNTQVAEDVIRNLLEQTNVFMQVIDFKMLLIIADPDDDKFVDCAFACGADYLITNDKHYNILEEIDFPKIPIIKVEKFQGILEEYLKKNSL
jgi:uncharacterized protein